MKKTRKITLPILKFESCKAKQMVIRKLSGAQNFARGEINPDEKSTTSGQITRLKDAGIFLFPTNSAMKNSCGSSVVNKLHNIRNYFGKDNF